MNVQPIRSTLLVLLPNTATLRFSAYGFGWGYRSFSLPYAIVREFLGASDTSEQQIRLAFELNRLQLLSAIVPCAETPIKARSSRFQSKTYSRLPKRVQACLHSLQSIKSPTGPDETIWSSVD